MNGLDKIKIHALALSVQERAKLAQILLYSLDDELKYESKEADWDNELEMRVKEILDRKLTGIPAEEVFAKIRKKYH